MRVAIVIWPAPAHLYPLVPLAWALRSAGHDVTFVSHPNIGAAVCAEGLPFRAICDEDDMAPVLGPAGPFPEARAELARITDELKVPAEDLTTWNTVGQFFLPSIWEFIPFQGSATDPMPAMDGMVTFFGQWKPDLVLWDPCMPGAAVAARVCGARHARYTGPDIVGWCIDRFAALSGGGEAPALGNPFESVRPMAEKYGIPVDRETLFGQWTVNPMPPAMNIPVDTPMVPVQWLPHSSQTVMPEWLYPVPSRPRIAITLGVSVRSFLTADWDYVPTLLDALGEMDVEVVATLDKTQLTKVAKIPDNVRIIDYMPLDQLIPTCSAVIHHGGLATMIAAGHARVPQLVVDFPDVDVVAKTSPDGVISVPRYVLAPATAAYLTSLGAGGVLDLSHPTAAAIRDRINEVMTDPTFQVGTGRLYDELTASPRPSDAVAILEKLTLEP
jgi:hypothetical protein